MGKKQFLMLFYMLSISPILYLNSASFSLRISMVNISCTMSIHWVWLGGSGWSQILVITFHPANNNILTKYRSPFFTLGKRSKYIIVKVNQKWLGPERFYLKTVSENMCIHRATLPPVHLLGEQLFTFNRWRLCDNSPILYHSSFEIVTAASLSHFSLTYIFCWYAPHRVSQTAFG